jgi:hypothetical protein
LCFSSFISQFLDFILFNHLFSFDSLDDCEFFLFNSFKLFIIEIKIHSCNCMIHLDFGDLHE